MIWCSSRTPPACTPRHCGRSRAAARRFYRKTDLLGRADRPCAGRAHPDPLHLRPRQPLHLERGGLCRGLTAGGKGCQSSFSGLPGYPGALALDEDSTLYISYRWASSSWLERHAGSTFLRGVALRLSESMQENLFSLPADGIRAEAVSTASGSWLWSFSGKPQGSSSALCPVENRVYFGIAGEKALYSVRV